LLVAGAVFVIVVERQIEQATAAPSRVATAAAEREVLRAMASSASLDGTRRDLPVAAILPQR
jgi:hypothetical protein